MMKLFPGHVTPLSEPAADSGNSCLSSGYIRFTTTYLCRESNCTIMYRHHRGNVPHNNGNLHHMKVLLCQLLFSSRHTRIPKYLPEKLILPHSMTSSTFRNLALSHRLYRGKNTYMDTWRYLQQKLSARANST